MYNATQVLVISPLGICVFLMLYCAHLLADNQSTPQEKVAQLQHIQHLLELLPPHRYSLVKKLTKHLIRCVILISNNLIYLQD